MIVILALTEDDARIWLWPGRLSAAASGMSSKCWDGLSRNRWGDVNVHRLCDVRMSPSDRVCQQIRFKPVHSGMNNVYLFILSSVAHSVERSPRADTSVYKTKVWILSSRLADFKKFPSIRYSPSTINNDELLPKTCDEFVLMGWMWRVCYADTARTFVFSFRFIECGQLLLLLLLLLIVLLFNQPISNTKCDIWRIFKALFRRYLDNGWKEGYHTWTKDSGEKGEGCIERESIMSLTFRLVRY